METRSDLTDSRYNGWTNYETWAVNLWLSNDESTWTYWNDEARAAMEQYGSKNAAYALARMLKDQLSDKAPDLGASLWSDLLGSALEEVDWYEIAKGLIDAMEDNQP